MQILKVFRTWIRIYLRVKILSFSDLRVNKRVNALRFYIPLFNGLGINKSVNSKLGRSIKEESFVFNSTVTANLTTSLFYLSQAIILKYGLRY